MGIFVHRQRRRGSVATRMPDCGLCGHGEFDDLFGPLPRRAERQLGIFQVQRCRRCGLVMTRPWPRDLGLYYAYYARVRVQPDLALRLRIQGAIQRYRLRVLERVRPLTPETRVLDVGCGLGDFLVALRTRRGCQGHGLDPDQTTITHALGRGEVRYHVGTILDADFPAAAEGFPDTYDLICFNQSLEHLPEPVAALRRARELLAPDGRLLVEVPDFGGLWRRVFRRAWMPLEVPRHLVHFERRTLEATLRAAGFAVEYQQTVLTPFEGTASLALLIGALWRRVRAWVLLPLLLLLLPLLVVLAVLELPGQYLVQLVRLAGHRTVVARPEAPASPPAVSGAPRRAEAVARQAPG